MNYPSGGERIICHLQTFGSNGKSTPRILEQACCRGLTKCSVPLFITRQEKEEMVFLVAKVMCRTGRPRSWSLALSAPMNTLHHRGESCSVETLEAAEPHSGRSLSCVTAKGEKRKDAMRISDAVSIATPGSRVNGATTSLLSELNRLGGGCWPRL